MSDKILLRELMEKDIEFMLEWMHDPDIQKNFRVPLKDMTTVDVKNFIMNAKTKPVHETNMHYAIVDEWDEYLGTISLKEVNLLDKNAEYAISLRKKAQGKGIAYKATREILKIAFDKFNFEKIYLNVLKENGKAIKLYQRCGFVYEGEFKRHVCIDGQLKDLCWYALLREDYRKGD